MTRVRLTDARAGRLKPSASEYSVHDKMVPALCVRVYPSGTKTWTCAIGGRKVSLGRCGLVSVEDARRESLRLLAEGVAPARDVPTYREFALGVWRESWSGRCKPSTIRGRDCVLKSRILPAFGSLRLDRITRQDVQNWFDAYSASAPGGANFTLQILRQSLNFAMERGLIDFSPAASVLRNRRSRLSRFLSRDEIRQLNAALDMHAGGPGSVQADIVRLLLLTGCRKGEIVRLKRREVHGDRLRLDDGKTGPRTVFLGPEAREIVDRRMAAPGEFLFPSPVSPWRPISGNLKLWDRIRREIGIEDVRLHDLRRSFASQCVIEGVPLPVVSRLLGHRHPSMTLRYANVADRDVEAAAERVGARISGLLSRGRTCPMPGAGPDAGTTR
ncbi:MAG: tyrosine-type recombinase/integrase [Boseongicola sp. SB0662_bin_57]|nr:site-specific integrase [Boseongicola sp.]MXX90180.1 tyrosine-type recombinase/integrase [Boseongicola sp. SB0665_bin_10]MYA89870.1 tyrosine-type recombinase/integrase [Boseongicola sp. SB0662_bin_57]MYG25238.1 tyrosine-type recombinase/integrase [Boseongicola sp. SB0677_bin_26]MYH59518.1 tyrosine-type recombinase/integrase [Boseongicola sp. SB0675_bin_26]